MQNPDPNAGPDQNAWLNGNGAEVRIGHRLNSFRAHPPAVEYSYYGVINAILCIHFPPDQAWLVKPQAPVRRFVPGHAHHPDSTGRSVDPDGRRVFRPDFMVTRFSTSGMQDAVNLIVEIKPADGFGGTAMLQLTEYMTRQNEELLLNMGGGSIRGLMISGIICQAYFLEEDGTLAKIEAFPDEGHNIRTAPFRQYLNLGATAEAPAAPAIGA